jgi:hypothetical protein
VVVQWEQDGAGAAGTEDTESAEAVTGGSGTASVTAAVSDAGWRRRSGSALGFSQSTAMAFPARPSARGEDGSSDKWVERDREDVGDGFDRRKWVRREWPGDSDDDPPDGDGGDDSQDDGESPGEKPWSKRSDREHRWHHRYDPYCYYDDYYMWYPPAYGYSDWWHAGPVVYYDQHYYRPDYYDTYYYTQHYEGVSPGYGQTYKYDSEYPYCPPDTPLELGRALRDIALSWLVEDTSLATSHLSEMMPIQARDERTGYERLFSAEELTDLLVVAFENIETKEFRFTDVEPQGDGQAWAEAEHVYLDDRGRRQKTHVHYHLFQAYQEWYVDALVVK